MPAAQPTVVVGLDELARRWMSVGNRKVDLWQPNESVRVHADALGVPPELPGRPLTEGGPPVFVSNNPEGLTSAHMGRILAAEYVGRSFRAYMHHACVAPDKKSDPLFTGAIVTALNVRSGVVPGCVRAGSAIDRSSSWYAGRQATCQWLAGKRAVDFEKTTAGDRDYYRVDRAELGSGRMCYDAIFDIELQGWTNTDWAEVRTAALGTSGTAAQAMQLALTRRAKADTHNADSLKRVHVPPEHQAELMGKYMHPRGSYWPGRIRKDYDYMVWLGMYQVLIAPEEEWASGDDRLLDATEPGEPQPTPLKNAGNYGVHYVYTFWMSKGEQDDEDHVAILVSQGREGWRLKQALDLKSTARAAALCRATAAGALKAETWVQAKSTECKTPVTPGTTVEGDLRKDAAVVAVFQVGTVPRRVTIEYMVPGEASLPVRFVLHPFRGPGGATAAAMLSLL